MINPTQIKVNYQIINLSTVNLIQSLENILMATKTWLISFINKFNLILDLE